MIDHRRGMYVHVRDNKTAWLLFAFVFVPFIGFFIGYVATVLAPNLASLATPLACNNGTLQTHQNSFSSGTGSVPSPRAATITPEVPSSMRSAPPPATMA